MQSGALVAIRVTTYCGDELLCLNDFQLFIRGIGTRSSDAESSSARRTRLACSAPDSKQLHSKKLSVLSALSGNFGGASSSTASLEAPQPPKGAPERTMETVTQLNLALLYRLCGDYNPLHVSKLVLPQTLTPLLPWIATVDEADDRAFPLSSSFSRALKPITNWLRFFLRLRQTRN